MTRRSIAVVLLGGLVACGGGEASPRELCDELVTTLCGKIYDCYTEAERQVAMLPPTEAGCVAEYKETYGCAEVTVDNSCEANETYHADKAEDCVDQSAGLSCEQIRDPDDADTPACGEICAVD